jgi:hypothetical protein
MKKVRHVPVVIIICLVIGVQGLIANDTGIKRLPHLKIVLFKFQGTEHPNSARFAEFYAAIRMAIINLGMHFVSYGTGFKYLSDLVYVPLESKNTPTSFKMIEKFYKKHSALEIHIGNAGSKTDYSGKIIAFVRDNIYLINSEAKIPTIEIVHNLKAEEYKCVNDIQQAITCYALAMDAKTMEKENPIVIQLLQESKMMTMNSIKSCELSSLKLLKKEILKSLEKEIIKELNDLSP